ncbi:triosephosphate isomerase [Paraglaciecola mesophila KMM 241]|uniref:Triosephosphate isomerase n=1 Tax=Paraglaciecola mesophila KMM 241 TaxID=1128912 RepID=K6Z7W5_9ALTE|nr:triose-phosphate isomerase [Paraglaciecola mesophila]GAC26467.1 triosephosphate isomerase [Paraglaciecola mesophila KMM 241]|tara:strand:- start:2193 stop:2942 length:750 start_codon:yes stop_codon:yes gene_type:complete
MQMNNRRPIVAGNWKMNGNLALIKQVEDTFSKADVSHVDVVVCPPFPYLGGFNDSNFALGGQNISQFESGAHTGEIAVGMLKEMKCQYVILGHSERRADNNESNELVADKIELALAHKLIPLFCVGEPEDVRESGQLFDFIAAQIDAVINKVGIAAFNDIVIAYEPIWAIGTGKTASPEQAQEVHAFIRQHLAKQDSKIANQCVILYGGSVKGSNADELFSQPDVDGGLIGGASLNPEDFLSICLAAKR